MQARMSKYVLKGSALIAAILPLGIAGAQETCKINDGSPYQLAGARNYVTMAANPKYPAEVPKHLANAIKVLTDDPEKIKNPAGRHLLLLRTYAQLMQGEGATYVVRRGDIGFSSNPDGEHNMLMAIDSSYNALVAIMPQCKDRASPYRDRFVSEVFNKAVQALQDEQLDSAVYFSQQTMLVSPKDARPWNVLASVYQMQEKPDSAKIAMLKVIELAGGDSTYKSIAQQHRYNMAILALNAADGQEGSAKSASIAEARSFLDKYLEIDPGNPLASQALGRALMLSGDTAAVSELYRGMTSDPEKFTDMQLFEAASGAAAAGRDEDAATLFEAGIKKNPYHRLGLLNASNIYFSMRNADKMEPLVKRLLEIDPNGKSILTTYAGYWQLRQRATDNDVEKKAAVDSTLAVLKAIDELSPSVEILRAGKSGDNFSVEGSVINAGDKEVSYTMKLEFLDASGQVVTTRELPVGPIAGSSAVAFNVLVEDAKAVAFRYAPLK